IASSSAVRPLGAVSIMRLCRSSMLLVKALESSARSLKLTRKNSSCGLAVLKNCSAASRALPILGVGNRNVDQRQVNIHVQSGGGLDGKTRRVFLYVFFGLRGIFGFGFVVGLAIAFRREIVAGRGRILRGSGDRGEQQGQTDGQEDNEPT